MPRLGCRSRPASAANLAHPFSDGIEHHGPRIAKRSELRSTDCPNVAIRPQIENAIGVEDGDPQLLLELAQQTEHPIDRATRCFRVLVDRDQQKAAVQQITRRNDRLTVCRPLIEKAIDGRQQDCALPRVERGRDSEDPQTGLIRQPRNVDVGHVDYTPMVSFAKLLQRFKGSAEERQPRQDPLRLSTAAILLETAFADGEFSPAEDGDVVGFLKRAFQLDDEAAQELIAEAAELRNRTIDHFALTNYIRKNATLQERIEVVKTMWRIVYSDRKLTDYENYLVRKLADLLGLEHHVMIEAKVSVLREMGLSA